MRPHVFPDLASTKRRTEDDRDARSEAQEEEAWQVQVQQHEEDILYAFVQLLAESDKVPGESTIVTT